MARKNAIVSVEKSLDKITLTVEGFDPIVIAPHSLNATIYNEAAIHGLVQKLSDSAALGKDATPGDKFAAIRATADRLIAGEWNKRADSDGTSAVGGIIFRALRNLRPNVDESKLRAWYDGKTRAEQLALRNDPSIKSEIERIKAERGATSKLDPTDLLDELDNLD